MNPHQIPPQKAAPGHWHARLAALAALLLLPAAALAGGTPDWANTYPQLTAYYGKSMARAGDVNNDGFEDVLVSAPLAGDPGGREGKVFAYHGSSTGLSVTENWRAEGHLPHIQFGSDVAGIGDVNGDGFDDVAIAAVGEGNNGVGAVYVWHGSAAGLGGGANGTPPTADWSARGVDAATAFGSSIAGAGDVNGDGFDDLLVGATGFSNDPNTLLEGAVFLWYGSASGLNAGAPGTPDNAAWMAEGNFLSGRLGIEVASAGLANEDGFADFAIAAEQASGRDARSGFVWLFYGSTNGPAAGLAGGIPLGGGEANERYGAAMTCGDFDFDGRDDLAVGSPTATAFQVGRVVIFTGGPTSTLEWHRDGESFSESFGGSLDAGDYDGDGFDDLLVGSSLFDSKGQVNLFRGDAMQLLIKQPAFTCELGQGGAQYGGAVAVADVNGDSNADLLIGAPAYDETFTDQGAAWMYFGEGSGSGSGDYEDHCLNPTSDLTIEAPPLGTMARVHFGRFIANAGDVNGDGFEDVIASGPAYGANEGAVFLFHGSASGLIQNAAFSFSDPTKKALGISVAAAGDVDDDGFDDVIVGATGWAPGAYNYVPGGAWVFFGSDAGLDENNCWKATSSITPDQFGFSVAGAGDVNGDGFDDVMVGAIGYEEVFGDDPFFDIMPRVYLWYGSQNGPNNGAPGNENNADWLVESSRLMDGLGRSICSAGDLDDDGYGDIVLGTPFRNEGEDLESGAIYTFLGSVNGLNNGADGTVGQLGDGNDFFIGVDDYELVGWSVSSADLNNDGYSDVIVGAPGYGSNLPNRGRVLIFYGSQGSIDVFGKCELRGDRPNAFFGSSVAGIADSNGDGFDDLMVGAWRLSNNRRNQGRVYQYLGNGAACTPVPNWFATGTKAGELMGASVAGADVNGDGLCDLIAGSPYHELPPFDESGLLTIWHGTSLAILTANSPVSAGDTLSFEHFGGMPLAPVLLAVREINGSPFYITIALQFLDEVSCWSFSAPVPPLLAGLDVTFQTATRNTRPRILVSNPVAVQFQ